MKGLSESIVFLAKTTPLSHLFLIFAVAAVACGIVSFIGWWLEDKLSYSRWEFVCFPFIFVGFGLWLVSAMSLVVTAVAVLQRILS